MARRSKQMNVWKIAWEWAENTEPEAISQENIETVYRIGVPKCPQGQCRKNCKANPNCLNTLGEKLWFGEIKDEYWLNCQDPEVERRGKNEFVGLKNLGATCYVNTFLQLWFHNHALRAALYACSPEEPVVLPVVTAPEKAKDKPDQIKVIPKEQQDEKTEEQKSEFSTTPKEPEVSRKSHNIPLLPGMLPLAPHEEPKSVYGHLQLLFAQLQYSVRQYIDPMALITSLGLNTAQQQDAQEFSKLFMSLLEETLSNQPDPEVQHVIQKQFGGDYFYVTRCSNCGTASKRLSRFYELDLNIQGHMSLNQYIKEFLKEEKLEGDNRYFCASCNSKQNAERYIELNTLPPVLNLQLLRFVFDRKTGYKKKLNSISQFPDVLDMREYLQNSKTRTPTPQRSKTTKSSPKTEAARKEAVPNVQTSNTDLQCCSTANPTVENKAKETKDEKNQSDQEQEKPNKKIKWYVWWAEGKSGIVQTWEECHNLIVNKKESNCKKFSSLEQAQQALEFKQKEIKVLQEIKAAGESKKSKSEIKEEEEEANKQQVEVNCSDSGSCASDNILETVPELVDLAECGDKENEYLYELRAVLVHHGPSAYSGHYVAHIKDVKSGSWYKFNDEEIEKIKGKLKLSGDEEVTETGSKPAKRTKTAKGFHSSKNAYMLVYTRQNWGTTDPKEVEAPSCVQELVAKDNSRFESWVSEVNAIRDSMVQEGKNRQSEIQRIYKLLPADQDYEWISTKWLREWMNEKVDHVPPVDNSFLLCSHGRLNPDKVQQAKKISCQAADLIFAKYGGLPRLKSECLCLECVKERCSKIRFQSKLAADRKFINDKLKAAAEPMHTDKWFWVGRMSLHSWRGLALRLYEEQHFSNGIPVHDTDDPDNDADKSATESVEANGKQTSDDVDKETMEAVEAKMLAESSDNDDSSRREFNEELLCQHGCLSTEESNRRLVPEDVWNKLKQYFPSASEFDAECCVCTECKAKEEEEKMRIESFKAAASEQRTTLNALYYDKQRPHIACDEKEPARVYVVAKEFLDEWRQFLRFPTRCPPPKTINNASLLCPHGNFLFDPQVVGADGADESLCHIFEHEWAALTTAYTHDYVITVTREMAEGQDPKLVSNPACCEECHTALMYEQARLGEHFRQATIYVRKVTEDHNAKEINQIITESQPSVKDTQDPDFSGSASKKLKLSDGVAERRSSRHRKQRGEVDVRVDSSLTLKRLKLELMKPFSVMPLDQHLSLNGTPLTDDTATLGRLGIRPGCLLLLKIDEPPQGEVITEDMVQVSRVPEEGFKGTGLLGH